MKSHTDIYKALNENSSLPLFPTIKQLIGRPPTASDLISLGLSPATLADYKRAFDDLKGYTSSLPGPTFGVRSILNYFSFLINKGTWTKASSLLTRLHQITAVAGLHGFPISAEPKIKALATAFTKLASFQKIDQAPPMDLCTLNNAITNAAKDGNLQVTALLALSWACALRVGDALRIPLCDIRVDGDPIQIKLHWHKSQVSIYGEQSLVKSLPFAKILMAYLGTLSSRTGLLLRGVKREEIERGQVLAAPGSIQPYTHFQATIYVLNKEEGGRSTPFFNNYRPQFYFRTTDVTGSIKLPDGVEMAMPGDQVSIKVELIAPVAMEEGMRFSVREGGRTVASGVISAILKQEVSA